MNKRINLIALIMLFVLLITACNASKKDQLNTNETESETLIESQPSEESQAPVESEKPMESEEESSDGVMCGDERFSKYLPLLEGKKVALFTNQTGMAKDEHILDALIEREVDVTAVFCPEHGFRGTEDAGAVINNSVDEKTGVPIISLHNYNTHAPAQSDMDRFDVLIVDIQDVGLRYYTYYITMYYLMDACAAYGKEVIVLDRPNPNGFYVDGPILQDAYKSGVGVLPIPIVHGMTLGELAQMINGEGWLKAGANACNLTVIPCKNYTHQTKYELEINPSPNLKDMKAIYLYASTCFFENTVVSVGRGTEYPFNIFGSPYLQGVSGYEFVFTPASISGATNPQYLGTTCYGMDLRNVSLEEIWEEKINLNYIIDAYHAVLNKYPEVSFFGAQEKNGGYFVDKLFGTDEVRKMIVAGKSAAEIEASWQDDVNAFKEQRKPYLLYAE